MTETTAERAARLMAACTPCDLHGGFEFSEALDLRLLERWKRSGIAYLSVNAGYDVRPWHRTVAALAHYRRFLAQNPQTYVQVSTAGDIRRARSAGKLAVAFDIEGMAALDEDLNMISLYYDLGVRQMAIAYNLGNAAGGGCHDEDVGLTDFGRAAIVEMNRVGMLVDCSHTAYRSTLEAMEVSSQPVLFSHANARSVHDHERNIVDEQATAAAATGGLVGVTGIGLFLDDAGPTVEALVRHIEYFADLIGIDHVAIGLDYGPQQPELDSVFAERLDVWPPGQYPRGADIGYLEPECFARVAEALLDRGYSDGEVAGVLGENFLHLAERVWR